MAKQDMHFNQSDWIQAQDTSLPKAGIGPLLRRFLSGLLATLMIVLTAPFVIVVWTINFIKSLFGTVIFWIVGKFCIFLFIGFVYGLLHNVLGLISEKSFGSIIDWYTIHILGMGIEKTATSFFMFPYFHIEIWLILVLAIVIATVTTLDKIQFNQTN